MRVFSAMHSESPDVHFAIGLSRDDVNGVLAGVPAVVDLKVGELAPFTVNLIFSDRPRPVGFGNQEDGVYFIPLIRESVDFLLRGESLMASYLFGDAMFLFTVFFGETDNTLMRILAEELDRHPCTVLNGSVVR
jgi:hypothetical protein